MVDFARPSKRPSTASSSGTRGSRLSWGSSLVQKSNTLSSMASSSLNALRRTRSRNDPPSSSGSNTADKQSPPLAASARSNSWTSSLGRRSSTKSSNNTNPTDSPTTTTTTTTTSPGPGIDRDPPTPPSESSSSRSSASSHETVTPPASAPGQQQGARVLSTLATLASPSTYYKPAARLFRPSSSSGSTNSRPSTAGSVKLSPFPSIQPSSSTSAPPAADMTSFARSAEMSTEDLDKHADQLIRAALQRTKDANALARTESNASTSSQSRPTADSSPSSSTIHHSASAPAVIPLAPTPSRTSWFGFGGGNKEERRLAKEEKRGRKSRPTSEVISTPISGITSRPTSSSGRPSTATGVTTSHSGANTPIASPLIAPLQIKGSAGGSNGNNFAAGGASLPSAPIMTIREGVPLTHSLTVDSVMTTASEDRRGRARARSSSPFRAFRSSRSRGGAAKEDKEKEKEKKREKSSGRSPSPAIHALKRSESDAESDAESLGFGMRRKKKGVKVRRTAFDQRSNAGETEDEGGEDDDDEEEWSDDDEDVEDDDDGFDPETTQNTEANATPMDPEACLTIEGHSFPGYDDDIELPDPLGEGVNVVRPEAPMFAQTLMAHTTRPTTSPTRARAASPRSVNTGGSGGDDAADAKQRSSSMDGIGAVASSPTTSAASPTTSSPAMGSGAALTPAQVAARTPKKKKTIKSVHSNFLDPLPLNVSRPHFTRDRCTVVLKHGHVRERSSSNATAHPPIPEGAVIDELGQVDAGLGGGPGLNGWKREPKRYVVFSDMSEESKWAVEWGIGTVLRDGDEMILVTVQETDSKLDPAEGATVDRLQKLRNQQERQALASLLVRQATSLLQRTKLNVTVTCQAMHAKNARRLFLDIIDLLEPTMVIVGSRGLGKLKGILLGSTSHYLIQKSSVPVMVARRRLKRPTRKSHTAAQAIAIRSEKRVSLAEARIEKMSSGQGKGATGVDVEDIQREHEQAEKEWPRIPGEDEVVVEEEEEDEEEGGANGGAGDGEEQQTPQSPSSSSRADSPSAEKRAPGVSGKVAGE